jgi:hypothetical protein
MVTVWTWTESTGSCAFLRLPSTIHLPARRLNKKGTGYFSRTLIHTACVGRSCTYHAAYLCQPATTGRDDKLAATIAAALGLESTLRRRGRPLNASEK